jgi:ribonuclease BN (tRNA processing enzyme)
MPADIRVLGCSGSMASGDRTTSFLLDGCVLLDAGSGVGDLTLEEMACVDDILVSHSHLDHVLGIPLLADSIMRRRLAAGRPPIRVHALPETLRALEQHLLNGVIWPDFTRLPTPERPVLALRPLEVGGRLVLGARCVEALPARHSVPAVGFAVFPRADGGGAAWVYSGDTGPNPALWARLAQLQVDSLVIETAFGDDDMALAQVSGHLHPARLADELRHLAPGVEVWVTHIKPGELDTIMREVGQQARTHRVRALQAGQHMALGGRL